MHNPDQNKDPAVEKTREKYQHDLFPLKMGIKLVEIEPGSATVQMETNDEMTNFHGIVHGGVICTLADTAFGLAGNSRGQTAVGLQTSVNFIRPVKPGTVLRATAREEQLTRTTGVYNIVVQNEKGETIALLRGTAFRKP